ncbi:helicase RepA family protein [Chloracidobacterium thermophilum]|uniref:AAA family ATPase n=1 Tax=Chloracidobacterium thermophilum TaxID=458033 RepID=UPI0007398997|nr:helicase RepA family protein [Chloracidobacterium thermophilum]
MNRVNYSGYTLRCQSEKEQPEPVLNNAPGRGRKFRMASAFELRRNPLSHDWLIQGFLEADTLALLFGEPAVGKSLLALDWAASIATGRAWCGRKTRQGMAVYLAGEGYRGLTRRLAAWEAANGQKPSPDVPLFFSECGAGLPDSVNAVIEGIDAVAVRHGKPLLVVIDTLARCFTGDENSAGGMSGFLAACDAMRLRYGCTVLIVHHSGHSDKGRARGYSSLPAAMDVIYQLEAKGGARTLACTKAKDFEPPAASRFTVQEVSLLEDDEPVTAPALVVCDESGRHK